MMGEECSLPQDVSMAALWVHRGLYKGGSNFFLEGRGGGQLLKRGSKEGRLNSYSLLYYTHLLISLSGNSTVVLLLCVKHSTPTLNKVYPILCHPEKFLKF